MLRPARPMAAPRTAHRKKHQPNVGAREGPDAEARRRTEENHGLLWCTGSMRARFVRLAHVAVVTAFVLAACKKPPSVANVDATSAALDSGSDASTTLDSGSDTSATLDAGDASSPSATPYGKLTERAHLRCSVLAKGKTSNYLANRDLTTSFVDGDDLLALVNRSPQGALSPDYAPTDMVDVVRFEAKTPVECDRWQCLRKDAATAMKALLAAMAKAGYPGHIESVYRSYAAQCATFQGWVHRSDFCSAAEQSALPGHSQHQLGTTIDLFTQEWKAGGETVFRQGFGCTKGGKWLQEHSWEHGFVFPYPIHPDDLHEKEDCVARADHDIPINPKTGYRYEHWHVRYIGAADAKAFHEASSAKPAREPSAITLEQWIREKRGLRGDTDLSVCDGCNCGACATLAGSAGVCGARAIPLDDVGLPTPPEGETKIVSARLATPAEAAKWPGTVVAVEVEASPRTLTQPPFVSPTGPGFPDAAITTATFVPLPKTLPRDYPALAGAVRIGVRLPGDEANRYKYSFGIGDFRATAIYNRANLLVPAQEGKKVYLVPLPRVSGPVELRVLKGGAPVGDPVSVEAKAP